MIVYKVGDLFNDDSQALVNTVNCVGVMGRGIALQFKKRYPDNFAAYEEKCKRGEMLPGKMHVYETNSFLGPRYIINFPTKRHWRGESRIEDIQSGLADLAKVISERKITSIAIPPLGSGLGGLDWNVVKGEIEKALSGVSDISINVYEPAGAPKAEDMARNIKAPKMTPGRAALVGLIDRYLGGLLDPFVTLLEVHKLMYFLQGSGEDLRLNYVKERYGPFAVNLSHVLNRVEGHMISGYADGGDDPRKRLELIPGAAMDAEVFLRSQSYTLHHMGQVSELIDGFETPFGMELLATVHWVVKDGASTLADVVKGVYAWNPHKKQFTERQIEIALTRLTEQGWI